MEALEIGAQVERCNSPSDSLILDGARGAVVQVLQAANGELGYFVRFPDREPIFCSGTRIRPVQ